MTALPAEFVPASRKARRALEIAFGCAILAAWLFIALAADWIAPSDPDAIDLVAILQPPGAERWLGTDQLGRDILTRIMYGARVDIAMSVFGVLPAMLIGVAALVTYFFSVMGH